jgi:hypothetical protein
MYDAMKHEPTGDKHRGDMRRPLHAQKAVVGPAKPKHESGLNHDALRAALRRKPPVVKETKPPRTRESRRRAKRAEERKHAAAIERLIGAVLATHAQHPKEEVEDVSEEANQDHEEVLEDAEPASSD